MILLIYTMINNNFWGICEQILKTICIYIENNFQQNIIILKHSE